MRAAPKETSQEEPEDGRHDLLHAWDQHRTLNPVVGHLCPYCAAARRRALGPCKTCEELRRRHERALGRLFVMSLAGVDDPAHRWVAEWKDFADPQQREVNAYCIAVAVSLWWEQHAAAVTEYLNGDFVATTLGTTNAVMQAAAAIAAEEQWPFPTLVNGIAKTPGTYRQRALRRDARLAKDPTEWQPTAALTRAASVLIVDDIYTTGASMHSAARRLRYVGVGRVAGLVFARHVTGHAYYEELSWRRRNVPVLWTPKWIWASAA